MPNSKTIYPIILIIFSAFISRPLQMAELIFGLSHCSTVGDILPVYSAGPPHVIAIDPGHGGIDTGALALAKEFMVIDTTAAYLYDMLDRDPDFIPIFTRTDTDPDSKQRAAVANSAGACLLISLHANSDSHRSSRGFECFPAPPGKNNHTESLKFATLIASGMQNQGHKLRGESATGVKYAYYSGSKKIIVDSSDTKQRSLPSFGILEKSRCPAVLVEQCFITNHRDVENWATETGCKKAAQIYYTAIKDYFAQNSAENLSF